MKRFEGKKILVTGISGGIGLHVAKRFLEEGGQVLGSYRRMKPELEELKKFAVRASLNPQTQEESENIGKETGLKLFELDTADRSQIGPVIKARIREFGKIDALVNCIGVTHPDLLFSADPEQWEKVVENNLFSAMRIVQAVTIPLISKKHGVILNISSIFGQIGGPGQSSYCASKAALDGMTRAIALELAPKKIRVNTVAPGFIDTDMTAGLNEKMKEESLQNIPLKRFGKPEEIAALCAYLASDEAAYITGQTFVIDGGLSAR